MVPRNRLPWAGSRPHVAHPWLEFIIETGARWLEFRLEHPHVASIMREISPGLLEMLDEMEKAVHPGDREEIRRLIEDKDYRDLVISQYTGKEDKDCSL